MMRVYFAASLAVTFTMAAAQTSTPPSVSMSPSISPTSTSSGSHNIGPTTSAPSVSCVFRYTMPTATNIPSQVSTTPAGILPSLDGHKPLELNDASTTMSDTEKNGPVGGPEQVRLDDPGSSLETDSTQSEIKVDTSDNNVSTLKSSTLNPITPTSPIAPMTSISPSLATTSLSPGTPPPPLTSTKAVVSPSTVSQPSTSTSTTPTSASPDDTKSTTPASKISSTPIPSILGSNDGRRRMDEVGGSNGDTTTTSSVPTIRSPDESSSRMSTSVTPTPATSTQSNMPLVTSTTPLSNGKTPNGNSTTLASNNSTPTTSMPIASTLTTLMPNKMTASSEPSLDLSSSSRPTDTVSNPETSGSTTIEFSCDSTFYSAWAMMGLTCEGTELNVESAVMSSECLIYSGTSSGTNISDLATCMSICRFPACTNGVWDYSSDVGISSTIYANLDLKKLMSFAGSQAAEAAADSVQQPLSNLTFAATTECAYTDDNSFGACQCASVTGSTHSTDVAGASTTLMLPYTVPIDKGLEDAHHWPDGSRKTTVDKVGIASTAIGSGAATVSIFAGGVMSVASGVVSVSSASVASSVSAAASVGITMAAVDICQFSVMLNQMNVDARPRFMENMGSKMSPAAFTFLSFGNSEVEVNGASSGNTGSPSTLRRLATNSSATSGSSSGVDTSTTDVQGMKKYAVLIGVEADMLFYVAVAGIACMVGIIFGLYVMAMGVCYFVVDDFWTFSQKWLDKTIGVLMMILILSEYVVGATAMYQICYCIDHGSMDASFFLAIATLLVLACGTILYGVCVIRNNEDELRDLGTKDHFEKKFHNRYGPLYDEHSFEGRFFFAPKLLLALLCGMTTGMVWIQGLWQIIILIAFHIVFLLLLEIKQPYPTAFVQKTSSFVIIIKISALFLSFFLLSSASSFTESIPDDLRQGVAFAIVGLQVLVLVCLMVRQFYIFYRTWKLKRDDASANDKMATVQTTNAREGSESLFALGSEPQYYSNRTDQGRGNSLAMLNDLTPEVQDPRHCAQETSSNLNNGNQIGGSQFQQGSTSRMPLNRSAVQRNSHRRNSQVDL